MTLKRTTTEGILIISCDECEKEMPWKEAYVSVDLIKNERYTETRDFCSQDCLRDWCE